MNRISIVVPVYNTQDYLEECIASILNQSVAPYELILVDDGSTDNSGVICDAAANKYDNVLAFHQVNSGQIAARRTGVEKATGDYIGFVDSDDLLDPDTLKNLTAALNDYPCDILDMAGIRFCGKIQKTFQDRLAPGRYDLEGIREYIIPNLFLNHDLYGNRGIQPSQCLKFFKSSLIKEVYAIIPENIPIGEDMLATYTAISQSSSMTILPFDMIGYKYRMNRESISWRYKKNLFSRSMILCNYLRNIPSLENNIQFQNEIDYEVCFFAINAFLNEYLMKNKQKLKERKETLRYIINSNEVRRAIEKINIKEVKAPNKLFAILIKKNKIDSLHLVGIIILLFRKPITYFSQRFI